MPFDTEAALALATETVKSFEAGLHRLVTAVREELDAEKELLDCKFQDLAFAREALESARARLSQDRDEIGDLQDTLTTESAKLASATTELEADQAELKLERKRLEEDRFSWGVDTVKFNVSGEETVSMLRSTFDQCPDSMLASALSGRWPIPKDDAGQIFINFPPKLFLPLVEYMQSRMIEDPCDPTPPPAFESVAFEAQFQRMLAYYGMLDWVYRPAPVPHTVTHGKHCYGVLPPCNYDEGTPGRDMQDRTLELPVGWEVLRDDADKFDEIINDLTSHCWGTHVLCAENSRGGFDSYRTSVRSAGGQPGSIFQSDIDWLESMQFGRQFRFRGLSGRIVIRARRDAVMAAAPHTIRK